MSVPVIGKTDSGIAGEFGSNPISFLLVCYPQPHRDGEDLDAGEITALSAKSERHWPMIEQKQKALQPSRVKCADRFLTANWVR